MASGDGPALAHRSVSNIRTAQGQQPTPSTPHTPPRAIPGSYGSPATVRADDDFLLIEIGSRNIRVGFAGDSVPKAVLSSGPQDQRRAGDFRQWTESEALREYWAPEYEIWRYDLRDFNLGLFQDKLERMLRDAFTRHLLIDSRPRRAGLVLDSAVPIPLLSSVLDILFTKFQAPLVSLLAAPTMTAVAAGMRSALVIDMGWSETVVTSVYEYREVKCTRSIRAGKSLLNKTYKLLHNIITGKEDEEELREANHVISFSECQDIMCRLMWCRGAANRSTQRQSTQLDTVVEQDETEAAASHVRGEARVPLQSTSQPKTIQVSFEKLADLCDDAMFDSSANPSSFDDHELPLHWLVYQHLLQLPLDVRAVCMSRIMFTGGCSNILGIKERLVNEVSSIVDKRGWTPVTGKGVDRLRNSAQIRRSSTISRSAESPAPSELSDDSEQFQSRPSSIATQTEEDAIEAKLARNRRILPQIQGQLRVLHSLGPWAGASLLCQLKIPAMATVDKELWLQQGASGASRASDVDIKMQQRQSMGAAGLIRAGGGQHVNWTLGTWGSI
ncbi:Actin-related protein 10 [Beauveria bassiana]|uniref:Actin-related protein RO7 n=1 Tax=Beauveria bassiana (strain ARSEF 2860) TaxID=655819 RepID=J5JHL9_BEAB2|nr:actin-related protein RO7 [Beauveria bassiana ARSEF 2860]EJP65143.1 actin-related protein RO7 [Beauveria bassiana ARSEF 2860]KAF1731829.1 Actin-related protein 10 [Beauveria bassiana]KAH8716072.1 Actin-related protein 10 [Beauveria bassiana]